MPPISERIRQEQQTVDRYKNDPAPASQDRVGEAEMRLAYFDAEKQDYESSRKRFLQVSKLKGTGAMGADFGGLNDQAAYQAIVCLVAEHKEGEAKAGFRGFMKNYPLSPLVHAAFKRLQRLNEGTVDPGDQKLLESAIVAQEKKAKQETAMCGPKTLAYLLENGLVRGETGEGSGLRVERTQSSNPGSDPNTEQLVPNTQHRTPSAPNAAALAALASTDDKGTSIQGMRTALKKLGIQSYGLELNRQDFNRLKLPAILLEGDHYFAVLERDGENLTVYDTLLNAKRAVKLPSPRDTDFKATVIAFELPDADLSAPPAITALGVGRKSPGRKLEARSQTTEARS